MSKKKTKKATPETATESTATAAAPADAPAAEAAQETAPAAEATADAGTDAGTTNGAKEPAANRLPAVGTRLEKIGKGGIVRGACTIAEGGKVIFHGKNGDTEHNSLSGAAMANIKDLGLATSAVDGFAWWGLKKRERVAGEGGTAAPRAPRTGNLTARREKLVTRAAKLRADADKLDSEIQAIDAKIAEVKAASPEGQAQAKLNEQAGALANV